MASQRTRQTHCSSAGWKRCYETRVRALLEQGEHTVNWAVHLDYELSLVDPIGPYDVIIEGESVKLQPRVEAYLPEEPRLYSFEDGKHWLL